MKCTCTCVVITELITINFLLAGQMCSNAEIFYCCVTWIDKLFELKRWTESTEVDVVYREERLELKTKVGLEFRNWKMEAWSWRVSEKLEMINLLFDFLFHIHLTKMIASHLAWEIKTGKLLWLASWARYLAQSLGSGSSSFFLGVQSSSSSSNKLHLNLALVSRGLETLLIN